MEEGFGTGAFGLFVGIASFSDPGYQQQPLPQAEKDVVDLKKCLTDRYGWHPDHVLTITGHVTKKQIETGFATTHDSMRKASSRKLFVLYLSTHGHPYKTPRQSVETVLLASNTLLDSPPKLIDTGLTKQWIAAYLDMIDARQKVVIIDACFSAAAISPELIAPKDVYLGLDVAVVASSTHRSFCLPGHDHSAFTESVLRVLAARTGNVYLASAIEESAVLLSSDLKTLNYPDETPYTIQLSRPILIGSTEFTAPLPKDWSLPEISRFARGHFEQAVHGLGRTEQYVPRAVLEREFEDFRVNNSPAMIVLGENGCGKSTLLAKLASDLIEEGYLVLWLSPTSVEPSDPPRVILDRSFLSLGEGVSLETVLHLNGNAPVFVFADAVNEWRGNIAQVLRTLDAFFLLADNTEQFRLVASCRDEYWHSGLTNITHAQRFEVVTLGDFSDEEMGFATSIYPGAELVSDDQLRRKPLILRMASELLTQTAVGGKAVSTADICGLYVSKKYSDIAENLGMSKSVIDEGVQHAMRSMLEMRSPRLAAHQFLTVTSEVIGVALLEAGLFRREGEFVVVEAELLHQYLLSFVLPENPFTKGSDIPSDPEDSWWKAAAFRLASNKNAVMVKRTLNRLLKSGSSRFILDFLIVVDVPQSYLEELTALAEQDLFFAALHQDRLMVLFRRFLAFDPAATFEVLRKLFKKETDYLWRRKEWDNVPSTRLESKLHDRGFLAVSLLECLRSNPSFGSTILLRQWLNDTTALGDKYSEATISDVAVTFLRLLANEYPGEIVAEIQELVTRNSAWNHQRYPPIIRELAHKAPETLLSAVERWYLASRFGAWATLTVVEHMPAERSAKLVSFITRVLEDPRAGNEFVNALLREAGNVMSRDVFDILIGALRVPGFRVGAVQGLDKLLMEFPGDAITALTEIAKSVIEASPEEKTLGALRDLFCHHINEYPNEAVAFFRQLIGYRSDMACEEIARAIHNAQLHPALSAFVADRLLSETRGSCLEYYMYYVVRMRTLNDADFTWLRRWLASGVPLYGVFEKLLISKVSFGALCAFLLDVDKTDPKFYQIAQVDDGTAAELKVKEFAMRVKAHPAFNEMSKDLMQWLSLVADGMPTKKAKYRVIGFTD
jgi:hypothetical protein